MPSAQAHLQQRDHNRCRLNESSFHGNGYLDSRITIMFYKAVHHVEAAPAPRGRHSRIHQDRLADARALWPQAYAPFETLYRRSMWARYNCPAVQPQDVPAAVTRLQRIEQLIL